MARPDSDQVVGFALPDFESGLQLFDSVLGLSGEVVKFPGIVLEIVKLKLGQFGEGVEGLADIRSA